MKAITVKQPWASLIAYGEKKIEHRTWSTDYRGPLLICAGAERFADDDLVFPHGVAVAVVTLADCRSFTAADMEPACIDGKTLQGFAWVLKGAREIIPFPVRGQLRLFTVDNVPELIDDLSDFDHIDLFSQQVGGNVSQR